MFWYPVLLSFVFKMFLVILAQIFTQLKFRITLSSKENTFKILSEKILKV